MPTTEAGKRLLGFIDAAIENTTNGVSWRNGAGYARVCAESSIPHIEAEAVTVERARIRAAVEGLASWSVEDSMYQSAEVVEIAAVLRIIDGEDTDARP